MEITNNISIGQFESDLRNAVKRLSRGNFDDSIREVCEHYEDLYQESLTNGLSKVEAQVKASEQIGAINGIARQIVNPWNKRRGFKLQFAAMVLLPFGSIFYWLLSQVRTKDGSPIWEFWPFDPQPLETWMLYGAGAIFALGILTAKKLSTPALVAGLLLVPVVLFATKVISFKSLDRYTAVMNGIRENMKQYIVIEEPKYNRRSELMAACLDNDLPNRQGNMEAFAKEMRDPNIRGFAFQSGKTGHWVYPINVQTLRPRTLPYLYLASTDSYSFAEQSWRSADKLRQLLPQMKQVAKEHFEARFQFSEFSIPRAIWIESLGYFIPFGFSFAVSLCFFGIGFGARKIHWRNRPVS